MENAGWTVKEWKRGRSVLIALLWMLKRVVEISLHCSDISRYDN